MVLDERNVNSFINAKKFPFVLGGILFGVSALTMIAVNAVRHNLENVWMVGGTELLLYLLANAIGGLIVKDLKAYLKSTLLAYAVNFILLFIMIYLLFGKPGFSYTDIFPIYAALLFSFFISIALIIIIRKVLEVLKE